MGIPCFACELFSPSWASVILLQIRIDRVTHQPFFYSAPCDQFIPLEERKQYLQEFFMPALLEF